MNQRYSSTTDSKAVNFSCGTPAVCTDDAAGSSAGLLHPPLHPPHEIECEVLRKLQNHPALKFSQLHVHRYRDGICIEGFLESNEYEIDLCDVAREVAGVTAVLNRVVMTRPGSTVPKKG